MQPGRLCRDVFANLIQFFMIGIRGAVDAPLNRAGEPYRTRETAARGAASLCFACMLAQAQPASAQAPTPTIVKPLDRPDPAGIAVPDMTVPQDKSDARRFDDYYYFYKPGVVYERAFADFDQCRIDGILTPMFAPVPVFVPIGGDAITPLRPSDDFARMTLTFGNLGGIIAGTLIAEGEIENTAGTNRKCLFYKGYKRYGTSRKIFNDIKAGTEQEQIARKALIASGAAPQSEALGP